MESTGNRLLITKMVCFDFKSYAEKISIGPFHHVSDLFFFLHLNSIDDLIEIFFS